MVNFRLISVLLITIVTFLIGIFIGQTISEYNMSEAKNAQDSLMSNMAGYELAYTILSKEDICTTDFTELQKERAKLGREVSDLEERLGSINPSVLTQKELYYTYQLREYILLREIKANCNKTRPLILYFYTVNNDNCIAQGHILDAVQSKYNLSTIYAIDYDAKNPSVSVIKEIYNISSTPSLVIDEKRYPQLMALKDIETLIESK
jgi:hypothetical protein